MFSWFFLFVLIYFRFLLLFNWMFFNHFLCYFFNFWLFFYLLAFLFIKLSLKQFLLNFWSHPLTTHIIFFVYLINLFNRDILSLLSRYIRRTFIHIEFTRLFILLWMFILLRLYCWMIIFLCRWYGFLHWLGKRQRIYFIEYLWSSSIYWGFLYGLWILLFLGLRNICIDFDLLRLIVLHERLIHWQMLLP